MSTQQTPEEKARTYRNIKWVGVGVFAALAGWSLARDYGLPTILFALCMMVATAVEALYAHGAWRRHHQARLNSPDQERHVKRKGEGLHGLVLLVGAIALTWGFSNHPSDPSDGLFPFVLFGLALLSLAQWLFWRPSSVQHDAPTTPQDRA